MSLRKQDAPSRLVLFDIDGTILWGGPLWRECFHGALGHHFPNIEFPAVAFGGKTDIQICREVMSACGFAEAQIDENMRLVIETYVERATRAAQSRAHEVVVLPGVRKLLAELSARPEVILGLLTGNVKKGAFAKLSCVGLQHYFKIGVYGDDHADRYRLPPLAVARAHAELGHAFSGKQIVIIGDTIHDVNCGKSIGVRSIAVGTGRGVATQELLAQNPDYYFKDLACTTDVISAICEDL